MAKLTALLLNTMTSTFNRSLTFCSFTPYCMDQSMTLSNQAWARDIEHDLFISWNTSAIFSQAGYLMYFGHIYGLECWNPWSFYNKAWKLSPFWNFSSICASKSKTTQKGWFHYLIKVCSQLAGIIQLMIEGCS